MVAEFIRERGVTACPPRTVEASHKATANGYDSPDSFLFRVNDSPRSPEQKLAAAKILQMLQDLAGKAQGTPTDKKVLAWRAEHWFFEPSDFEPWCEAAGFVASTVRAKAREILQNGWPKWRAEAGGGIRYEERKAYRARTKQVGQQ